MFLMVVIDLRYIAVLRRPRRFIFVLLPVRCRKTVVLHGILAMLSVYRRGSSCVFYSCCVLDRNGSLST